ncbi:MAG TPA: hypothetical protein VN285_03295 [Candidatus Deferrimicrobium sp.]|nr:hypothetical protein [Candidatus Deferrimicrobium sp.]
MSLRQGELTSACRQFERAIEIESTGWQAHYYLGLVLGRQERYEESLESLHSGLAFAPQDKRVRSRIYLALAECWENQRKYRHAELNYITALNLDPDSSPAADGVARMRNFEHQPGR